MELSSAKGHWNRSGIKSLNSIFVLKKLNTKCVREVHLVSGTENTSKKRELVIVLEQEAGFDIIDLRSIYFYEYIRDLLNITR